MTAISTLWNCDRHTDGEALLSELRTLGLTAIEVSAGAKISQFPGFRRVLEAGRIRVVSLANFSPLPIDSPLVGLGDGQLTSSTGALRDRALDWTRITIDYAASLEASFVVLRLGPTGLRGVTRELFRQVRAGGLHSRRFVATKLDGIREREQLGEAWLGRARRSLENLVPFAAARGIRLALSGGEGLEEGPTEEEMTRLLSEFGRDGTVGYWHDFAGTQKKANLGFLDHAQWLTERRDQLFGCHASDVKWPDEGGCVPLSGMIDFETLMPLLPPGCPVVWNVAPCHRAAELRQMLPAWEERFSPGRKAAS
jgi:sugar phosphate isomerase/epimerase